MYNFLNNVTQIYTNIMSNEYECSDINKNEQISDNFLNKNKTKVSANVTIKEFIYFKQNNNTNGSYFVIYNNNKRYRIN